MTTDQRDKYAYKLMVNNNPDEAVKQLLSKDKIIEDKLKEIELSLANELAVKNKRINMVIKYLKEALVEEEPVLVEYEIETIVDMLEE